MSIKKCNRCKRDLLIEKFEVYSGERGMTNLKSSRASFCKECRSELRLINLLKKKYYIIKTIFNGKCSECDTGLIYLPSFEFHHPDPDLKTTTWSHIKHMSIRNIISWIKREEVIVLCSNCHEMKKDKYFIDFKNLILRDDLFNYSADKIDEIINIAINNHPNYSHFKDYKRNIKIQIKKYIRKRFVFNQLFSGKCIGCRKASIFDYLPTLELHHIFPENSGTKSNWGDIANQDCLSIINQVIEEDSICLCSNCHILIGSKLNNYLTDVMKDKITRDMFLKNYTATIANINSFEYKPHQIDLRSPLKLKFSQDEFWKIRLMQTLIILKSNKRNDFKVKDLSILLNLNKRTIRNFLDKLISLDYIKKTQEIAFPFDNWYEITDLGEFILKELKITYHKTYRSLKNDISCMEDYMNRQNRWIK